MSNKNIGYIWYSLDVIEKLYYCKEFNLKVIFIPKNRVTSLICLFAESRNIDIHIIENAESLYDKMIEYTKHISCCLMYDCWIIISKKTIDIMDIYNVHPGDLNTNRGNNPLEYAIICNEKYVVISLHKINEQIDMGLLIYTRKIPLLIRDSLSSIENKIYDHIDKIIKKLYCYLSNTMKTKKITEWNYNKKITVDTINIDIYKDSPIEIYNKIRGTWFHMKKIDSFSEIKPLEKQFRPRYNGGVKLNIFDKNFFITEIIKIEINFDNKCVNILQLDNNLIIIEKGIYKFFLRVSK